MRKLCVIAPPGSQVCNIDLIDQGIRRFLEPGVPVEVRDRSEWLSELRKGALLPGDEKTAKRAGVSLPAKPKKGGE